MKRLAVVLSGVLWAWGGAGGADAASVTFYSDRSAFESVLSAYTTVDFGGIAPSDLWVNYTQTMTDVEFAGNALLVMGENPPNLLGAPYQSASLANGKSGTDPITADLTAAGSGFTAVGGWFGNLAHEASTTLVLTGLTGVLDTRTVAAGDMNALSAETFYGWTVFGDEIVGVSHTISNADAWASVDNFTYGYTAVPLPGAALLLGSGPVGAAAVGRRRLRREP